MSTDILPFHFQDQAVRIIDLDGEPWFVLADLASVLEITNARNVAARLDDECSPRERG